MARNAFYRRNDELFDVMLGVHVTNDLKLQLEQGAADAQRTQSDFVRIVLEKGLKAVQDERLRKREPA